MARKGKKHEEHENHERWLITYADLITLLLGLFAVLYASSQVDMNKYRQIVAAFNQLFGGGGVLFGGKGVLTVPAPQRGGGESKESEFGFSVPKTQEKIQATLSSILKSNIKSNKILITSGAEGITVHLLERLLFESGSADLKPEAKAVLDTIAEILRLLPNDIRIEGHTDDRPIHTPKFPSNWHLSIARALNTAYYLMERGVKPEKISIAGYAEFRPIAPNDTEENRAKNRRVDIVIITRKKGPLNKNKIIEK